MTLEHAVPRREQLELLFSFEYCLTPVYSTGLTWPSEPSNGHALPDLFITSYKYHCYVANNDVSIFIVIIKYILCGNLLLVLTSADKGNFN